ncbi:MAG: hypothetical protein GDA36_03430 [Rhodobacteraceae bacterium]|nr:hypothetical protein [Paracoccaceae bacterium]
MTAQPLRLYLDTSDYGTLFNGADDGPAHDVLKQLLQFRDRGAIVIGYSWVIMLEFITRPIEKYRKERVRRGQLVKGICGSNAFPFISDLKNGARFPNHGIWIPDDSKVITAKQARLQLKRSLEELDKQPEVRHILNRAERRKLGTKSGKNELLRNARLTKSKIREILKDIPVSDELIESEILMRFVKGRCSDAEFEERMNRWLSDPAEFSQIVYDYADMPNLIDKFFGPGIAQTENLFRQLQEAFRVLAEWNETSLDLRQILIDAGVDKREARQRTPQFPVKTPDLDLSDLVQKAEEQFGKGRADHIAHYIRKAVQKGYSFKNSDAMDIMQMVYVPDCDLFRCDKAMASLYRDYDPFKGKLVPKFTDLPQRIEERLRSRTK